MIFDEVLNNHCIEVPMVGIPYSDLRIIKHYNI